MQRHVTTHIEILSIYHYTNLCKGDEQLETVSTIDTTRSLLS